MTLNIVMVGFFAAITGLLSPDALRQAVADSVPDAFVSVNLRAFDKGFEYGLNRRPLETDSHILHLEAE